MKKTEKNKKPALRVFFRAFQLVFRASPIAFFGKILLALLAGVFGSLMTPANAYLFSSAEKAASGNGTTSKVILGAVLVISAMLASNLLSTFTQIISTRINQKLLLGVTKFFYLKVGLIPPIRYENHDFLQTIEKSSNSINVIVNMVDECIKTIVSFAAYFVIMSGVLLSMDPLLIIALVITFVPSILLNFILPEIEEKSEDKARPYWLRARQYRENARDSYDTRIYGAFSLFDRLYYDNRKKEYELAQQKTLKLQSISFIFQLTKIAGWVGILLLLVRSISHGQVSAGEAAAVLGSVSTMYIYIDGLLSGIKSGSFMKPYAKSFFDFIDAADGEEKEKALPDIASYGIQAENVSFTYPGADKPAVSGVNLNIRPGELVAVVGENGSGKTTLSKLLMGLYVPDKGCVTIGGRDASTTDVKSLVSKTGAVFQNFIKYTAMTLSDNVRISSPDKEYTPENISSALSDCSLNANDEKTFPQGLETMLGREFNGSELSGGQWQRLATARGLYRDSDWLVLDEPTSAIDPLEEDRLYRRFAELAKGKTALLITHRLGSARIANRIIVMDSGRIVEEGRHEELLAKKGKYTEMWEAQASGYIDSISS